MQGNGDTSNFGWLQGKILQQLEYEGMNPDYLEGLREKVEIIEGLLQTFRTECEHFRQTYQPTAQGLEKAARERAATFVNKIKELMDDTYTRVNLAQKRAKLQPQATGDMADRIIAAFEVMEIRTLFQPMILLSNPQTGAVTVDALKADQLYRDAMQRGDRRAMAALEGWPLGSPVSAELIAQGQQQRQEALNPILAKEIRELETLHEQLQRITRDALQELPLSQPDPITAMARGESVAGEGETE